MAIEETSILISDLDDIRGVLAACAMFFQARDLMEAQVKFSSVRPSALSLEIDRVQKRASEIMSDYLLAAREAQLEEEYEEEPEDEEEGDEEEYEELPAQPLGEFRPPRQEGRRLSAEELAEPEYDEDPEEE